MAIAEPSPEPRAPHPHEAAYAAWQQAPGPDTLSEVVRRLEPTTQGVLRQINMASNPIAVQKARVMTGKAVRTYSPQHGTSLATWVNRQLQPMRRYGRTNLTSSRVPERIQLDALAVHRAEQEFVDKYQREPDLVELADHSKIPTRRIAEIRRTFRRSAAEGSMVDDQGAPAGLPGQQTDDPLMDEAIEYVYRDVDAVDRRIIEMKTGFGGKYDPMDHASISTALKIPAATVSRRAYRTGLQIQKIHAALQSVTGAA